MSIGIFSLGRINSSFSFSFVRSLYACLLLLKFLVVSFLAPFFETIFLNFFPFLIVNYFIKKKIIVLVILSLLFSFLHYYSFCYMVFAFISGMIINLFFIIMIEKNSYPPFVSQYFLQALCIMKFDVGYIQVRLLRVF